MTFSCRAGTCSGPSNWPPTCGAPTTPLLGERLYLTETTALMWGLVRPGDRVAVSRNLHKSLLVAMILGGVEPVWIFPEVDPATGLALGYPQASVEEALAQDVAAVFLVNPTYVGVMTLLGPIVQAADARGLPVAVDQAWGGHLGLDPRFPADALGEGADALVLSVHKTLTGFTQSALVLAQDGRIDLETLDAAFELGHPPALRRRFWRASTVPERWWRSAAPSWPAAPWSWRSGPASSSRRFRE